MNLTLLPRKLIAAAFVAASLCTASAIQESGPSQAAMAAGEPYLRALLAAVAAFSKRDFPTALEKLDDADKVHADIPDTWNLRGAIYAEQHAFEKAGDAFERAGKLNPGDFWPGYNLAQLLLVQKRFAEAEAAFVKLQGYKRHLELVQFKLVLTRLLQGKTGEAHVTLEKMQFPGDTPAYYFANAAYAYATKNEKQAIYWYKSGVGIFGQEHCVSFYDALTTAGWTPPRNPDGTVPVPTDLTSIPARAQ